VGDSAGECRYAKSAGKVVALPRRLGWLEQDCREALDLGLGANTDDALAEAAVHGSTEVIQLLLDAGAVVNMSSTNHGCPLSAAASAGNVKAVQLLLDAGADIY
jgi:ankyrin repeat protein